VKIFYFVLSSPICTRHRGIIFYCKGGTILSVFYTLQIHELTTVEYHKGYRITHWNWSTDPTTIESIHTCTKETTPRRRITITSSLNDPLVSLEIGWWWGVRGRFLKKFAQQPDFFMHFLLRSYVHIWNQFEEKTDFLIAPFDLIKEKKFTSLRRYNKLFWEFRIYKKILYFHCPSKFLCHTSKLWNFVKITGPYEHPLGFAPLYSAELRYTLWAARIPDWPASNQSGKRMKINADAGASSVPELRDTVR
jgi:hypothetical protein